MICRNTAFLTTFLLTARVASVQGDNGPSAAPREGMYAGLDANPDFKEVDYLGKKSERLRYAEGADFTFDFPAGEGELTSGVGGASLQVSIDNKPALYGSQAMSQTMFKLVPCGLNVPHLHSRAAKVLHVLEGEVSVGFVEEGPSTQARTISTNLTAGQSFIIPTGLAMWVHNLQCNNATYLDTWSNADPGVLNIVQSLMKMPIPTIATALGVDTAAASELASKQRSPVQQGPAECLARCNAAPAPSVSAENSNSVVSGLQGGTQAINLLTAGR